MYRLGIFFNSRFYIYQININNRKIVLGKNGKNELIVIVYLGPYEIPRRDYSAPHINTRVHWRSK